MVLCTSHLLPCPHAHPLGRAGDSRGNEQGFDQSFAMAVWVEIPGVCFIFIQKAVVLPTSSPHRVGLLAGICWTKSQSPHYFRYSPGLGGGPWLQMTSALRLFIKAGLNV